LSVVKLKNTGTDTGTDTDTETDRDTDKDTVTDSQKREREGADTGRGKEIPGSSGVKQKKCFAGDKDY